MKSITIHGIDDPLAKLLKSRAQAEGLSLNKTVKKILEESLGVKPPNKGMHRSEFEEFSGMWSQAEIEEFEENTNDLRKIQDEDWQ